MMTKKTAIIALISMVNLFGNYVIESQAGSPTENMYFGEQIIEGRSGYSTEIFIND